MAVRFQRCQMLFGEDFARFQHAKVLLLGVGGVGGFALDCLYRSGITNLTIVDFDYFEITNQNRQIGSEALGQSKVMTLAQRYPNITPIHVRIDSHWINSFQFDSFDLVLDCIDDISAKVAIAQNTWSNLIVSCGSAKRTDPTKISVSDLWKIQGDRFCRKYRDSLKKHHFSNPIKVVHSLETAQCTQLGSFVGVTGAFGLTLCAETIKTLRNTTRT
jgi:tRNA threonylcarbamoyladenosine dehydratase